MSAEPPAARSAANRMWRDIVQRAMQDHPDARLIVLDDYGASGILKIAQADDRSGAQLALRNLIGLFIGLRNVMCAQDRLAFEVRRLRELAGRGISVPAVLAQEANWVVMQRLERPWLDALEGCDDLQRLQRLTQAFAELGRLHGMGEWHGGAQLRNLMWHQGKTGKRIKWLILPLHESETDRHLIGLSG